MMVVVCGVLVFLAICGVSLIIGGIRAREIREQWRRANGNRYPPKYSDEWYFGAGGKRKR